MRPKLSIVLPAVNGYETIRAALNSWEAQSCREQFEILILYPDEPAPTATPGQVPVCVGSADLPKARAMGIERASGEYVMLAEDHCIPDADWMANMLARLESGEWDAIGSVLRPGLRESSWTDGSFLIGYGEWMVPVAGGRVKVISGWNCVIRTELFRELGSEVANELVMGAFLISGLRERGCRLYLEDRAQMRHFDPPGWAFETSLHAIVGLSFGAMRTRHWPLLARILYPLGAPVVALLHWKRAFMQYRRAGVEAGLRPGSLAAALVFASSWSLGEGFGAWLGIQRVAPHVAKTEVKPVSLADVARSTAAERSAMTGRAAAAAAAGHTD